MRIPREDPLAAPSAVKRFTTEVAKSDTGIRCAAWYLKNVVPRIDQALSRWSGGRLTSLPITPVVFLQTNGAATGKPRATLLTYFNDGDDVILVASNYGRPRHPACYYNVKANPEVILRAREQEGRYLVRETVEAEGDRLWA